MRPSSTRTTYKIVSADEARRLTGLEPEELRKLTGVQILTRAFADGREELAVRLPTELVEGPSAN